MAKEVKQSIEELTAWVNESKGTRGVIILAAENIKINEDGATEGDASICVAGRGDLLCHLYEIGITAKDDNNPLRLIHRRVMRKLDLRKVITALTRTRLFRRSSATTIKKPPPPRLQRAATPQNREKNKYHTGEA